MPITSLNLLFSRLTTGKKMNIYKERAIKRLKCDAKKPKDMASYNSLAEDTEDAFNKVISNLKSKAPKAVSLLKSGDAYQSGNVVTSALQFCIDELSQIQNECRTLKRLYE